MTVVFLTVTFNNILQILDKCQLSYSENKWLLNDNDMAMHACMSSHATQTILVLQS